MINSTTKVPTYPNEIKNYEKIRVIGKGSFGLVYEAIITKGNHTGEHVAIKEVNLDKLEDKNLDYLCNEITIMTEMIHENLIRLYKAITKYNTIYIIMPLMSYGDLSFLLSFKYPNGIKDEVAIATIMRDCLKAIECLNEHNYFHRDIKASNILLASNGSCRLGDFGVSTVIKKGGGNDSYVGSLCWMAPEIAQGAEYNFKVDIWSLGITAIEIANGKPPFLGLTPFEYIKTVVNDAEPQLVDGKHVWSQEFKDFVKSCLVKDPKKRPCATEILTMNKKFFEKAKDNNYILKNLFVGIPTLQERFPKTSTYGESSQKNQTPKKNKVNWDFGNISNEEKTKINNTEITEKKDVTKNIKDMFNDLNEEEQEL